MQNTSKWGIANRNQGRKPDSICHSLFAISPSRGFTLIEIIVSLAIFSIVATVAIGALIKIVDANRKAQSLQSAITNLNFALESMSREMRVGTKYNCASGTYIPLTTITTPQPCTNGSLSSPSGGYIAFNSAKNDPTNTCRLIIAYRFNPDATGTGFILERAQQQTCGVGFTAEMFSPVVDPNVHITGYFIRISGGTYPFGVIRLSGYAGVKEKDKTYFDLQTGISARVL